MLLRVHCGITAYQARHVLPGWERDMLINHLTSNESSTPAVGDSFASVPPDLRGL